MHPRGLPCATVLVVSKALLHGLPVLVILLLIVIYLRAGKKPDHYRLSQPWTHGPILWSATEEVIPGESVLSVGGGASGRW